MAWPEIATQEFPFPYELDEVVRQLRYLPGWVIKLDIEERGQGCSGLTLTIYPEKPDSYHPDQHVRTRFTYPVPAAAFNRESWEEWLWQQIEDVEGHERAEWFRFEHDGEGVGLGHDSDGTQVRRPYKPAHPDGWNPGVIRTVVSDTVTNTPNAGRLVSFPCGVCDHEHQGRMGENFRIEHAYPCRVKDCGCQVV